MNTWALALRNLLRNRRRSQNIVYGLQSGYVRGGGHLQLQQRDYALYGSGDPTAYGIADYVHVIEIIRNDPGAGTNKGAAQLELSAATASGAPNVARLNVVKAEAQGVKEFDDVYVALHLGQAQRLLFGTKTPEVTAIVLQPNHSSQIPAAQAGLMHLLHTTCGCPWSGIEGAHRHRRR